MKKLKVGQCRVGIVKTNCYGLMNTETGDMILVDPGDDPETIVAMVEKLNGNPVAIFLTHGHYDHILAVEMLKVKYKVPVYACREEAEVLENVSLNLTDVLHRSVSICPEVLLEDEEEFHVAGFRIQAIHTPGHTKGSMCFYFPDEKMLISGDTLFCESVGRTDLPTGDAGQILKSVRRLLGMLPQDVDVLPGHEAATTIEHEKRHNPFV